jgi:putative SOS response-associated peptidase YedK
VTPPRCGRYEAGQKQTIAEAFHVSVDLEDFYFGAGKECAPGSVQPVIYMKGRERQVGEMRWGFKLPDRLLFNARSESVKTSQFWKGRLKNRCILPAGSFFEWKKTAPEPRPNIAFHLRARWSLEWLAFGGRGTEPKDGQVGRHICDYHH